MSELKERIAAVLAIATYILVMASLFLSLIDTLATRALASSCLLVAFGLSFVVMALTISIDTDNRKSSERILSSCL